MVDPTCRVCVSPAVFASWLGRKSRNTRYTPGDLASGSTTSPRPCGREVAVAQPEPSVEVQPDLSRCRPLPQCGPERSTYRARRRSLFGQSPLPYRRRSWAEDRGPRQWRREEEQDMPHAQLTAERAGV